MAQNSRFIPTISHAMSVSWPGNVQSPTLRRKLIDLANSLPSQLLEDNQDQIDHIGTAQRLATVIQARLWGMMQRKLYDASAAKKIWRKTSKRESNDRNEEEPDLFDIIDEKEKSRVEDSVIGEWEDLLAGDDHDEFDDLLAEDQDDEFMDLLDDAESERRAVERETDEMLLGDEDGWGEKEDISGEQFLLHDGESEGMLL